MDKVEKLFFSHSKTGLELKKTQSRAGNLEIELNNIKSERDAMKKRIDSMKKELDNQKTKVTEAEMLRLERDRLQIKLNELADIQVLLLSLLHNQKLNWFISGAIRGHNEQNEVVRCHQSGKGHV